MGGPAWCTLKVNRVTINGFYTAVRTSMKGGAQVDMNYCDISDVSRGLEMNETRQNTNVNFNNFVGSSTDAYNFNAVHFKAGTNPTKSSSLVMYKNTFEIGGIITVTAAGFFPINPLPGTALSLVVRENTFNCIADVCLPIHVGALSNAVIINNRFNGTGYGAIVVSPWDAGTTAM